MEKKKTYRVYGIASASTLVGEYEANSEEEAIRLAQEDREANYHISLCHQCAGEVDVGDIYKEHAEEAE